MFDMKDRVILITGSSRGIGRASALQLAQAGARVVVSSRKAEACEAVVAEILAAGGKALAIPCHVGERAQVEALVESTMDQWGRIDGLVCNAATNPTMGPLSTLTDDVFAKIMQVNVQSTLWLSNLCSPIMAKQGGGVDRLAELYHRHFRQCLYWGLWHVKSRRRATGAEFGRGAGAAEYPCQFHCPWAGQDRLCQGDLGQS